MSQVVPQAAVPFICPEAARKNRPIVPDRTAIRQSSHPIGQALAPRRFPVWAAKETGRVPSPGS